MIRIKQLIVVLSNFLVRKALLDGIYKFKTSGFSVLEKNENGKE
jgi:hypothetical protein